MSEQVIEIRFTMPVGEVPDEHKVQAERYARQAYVLSLLRQGDDSAGRAAEVLGINRWQLADLMSAHGISPFDETMTREELEREVADTNRSRFQPMAP